jgi:hypothetical protein
MDAVKEVVEGVKNVAIGGDKDKKNAKPNDKSGVKKEKKKAAPSDGDAKPLEV